MKKVLSIDDSRMVRMQVKKAFQNYDLNVLEAANGIEGLEMTRKHKPDLVFLDITMPEMSGEEMLPLLREDSQIGKTPVIMLSADLSKETMIKMARLGSNDYIPKPFKHEQLVQKAKRFLGDALDAKVESSNVKPDKPLFKIEEAHLIVSFPEDSMSVINKIKVVFPDRLMEAVQNRVEDVFLDLSGLEHGSSELADCMKYVISNCESNNMRCHIIAPETVQEDVKGHQQTKGWSFYLPDQNLE